MRKWIMWFVLCALLLAMAGCGKKEGQTRLKKENTVETVINDQTGAQKDEPDEDSPGEERQTSQSDPERDLFLQSLSEPDYDLTEMSSGTVFAVVNQMMTNPEEYVGKIIRMEGKYYGSYYEGTGQYYHYCVIKDAAACCSQGIEFVWGDGTHRYPDEYPEEETTILVQGVFETYREAGSEELYMHLTNAELYTANPGRQDTKNP